MLKDSESNYAPFLYPQDCMVSTNEQVHDCLDIPVQTDLYTVYPDGTGKLKQIVKYKLPSKGGKLESVDLQSDFEGAVVNYTLVSHGEPNHNCGEIRAKLFCDEENRFLHDLPHICHRAVCPICWSHWVERETKVATEKFLQGLQMLNHLDKRYRAHHVVFSVPPAEYHLSPDELRRRLNYRLRVSGSIASCVIYHGYRFRNKYTKEPIPWKNCSLNRNAESPIIESEPYFSPHFHTACIGYLMPSNEFEKRFKWTYRKMDNRQLNNIDRFRRFIWYALSHATVTEGKHVVTWAGKFGTNSMIIVNKEVEQYFPKCKFCGSLIRIEYQKDVGDYVEKGQTELYSVLITKRHYKFKELQEDAC